MTDGIAEGGLVWLPGFGLGRVLALDDRTACIDVPRFGHVLQAMRWVLIPEAVAEVVPAAQLSNEWGRA